MHNPFTVVLFISFNSDWPFNGATLVFHLCAFKETIWDSEATKCFGKLFWFFLKFQIWRSIKVWLRFIKQYWNWIKVRRSGHDNRRGGERLAANDLIIISPSGDGLDSSSGTDSPDRTGLDVDFSTWPCHNRQNCIQTPASNREEEGTYISYDKLVTSHSVTSFV